MWWIVSVCCLALLVQGVAGAAPAIHEVTAGAASAPLTEACAVDIDTDITANAEYFWRARAYRQLDCVIGTLERAMQSTNGDVVTLSREDAERLRSLAFWAKDAAARIGR